MYHVSLCISRPDMTFAVDWALNNNYPSIIVYWCIVCIVLNCIGVLCVTLCIDVLCVLCRDKGVKVELGIPFELWDKPSAEITNMQRSVSTLFLPGSFSCWFPLSLTEAARITGNCQRNRQSVTEAFLGRKHLSNLFSSSFLSFWQFLPSIVVLLPSLLASFYVWQKLPTSQTSWR